MSRYNKITIEILSQYLREEFLACGYEKASLNRVSARAGVTTAALYKHFAGKEDMFYSLVKDTLEDLNILTSRSKAQMGTEADYNPFQTDWPAVWVDFIYSHYTGMKLLVCCSAGSKFEGFEDSLIQMEAEGNKAYAGILNRSGKRTKSVSDRQWHILATSYVHLLLEVVRRDMTREEALEHMHFIGNLLYPGWRQILGIEE